MPLQDRLDELTNDRDRRFQEREADRAEQVNGNDYNPVEINPWTEQSGDVVSNGQIPPGMPVTELQTPEGGTTIEGPNSPRPKPKPQPKKPYLENNKPVVVGYLAFEDYTSSKKLVSACWTPPGYVAVGFAVERETGQPVDYTCPRYEFHWLEDGDGECRPTPDPQAPYETMSACRNDPNNEIWLGEDGSPLGTNGRDGPHPIERNDRGDSSIYYVDNFVYSYLAKRQIPFEPDFDEAVVYTSAWGQAFVLKYNWSGDSRRRYEDLLSGEEEGQIIEKTWMIDPAMGTGYFSPGVANPSIPPNGFSVTRTGSVWYQTVTRTPGSLTSTYSKPIKAFVTIKWVFEIFEVGSGGQEFSRWSPYPSIGEALQERGIKPPPVPKVNFDDRKKKPEQGEPSTVERQFWVSEPNEQDPNTYKPPYKVSTINAEEDSEISLAYWRTSQGFVKHGRHMKSDETEEWCKSTQFGDNSPTPWNEGVGKSLQLNPPASLNRSACARQFSGSLTHNVLDSTLGKVIEIDPQQEVLSITSTPTTQVKRPLDQELDIVVADSRMSDPAVRDIAVKVKVYDILPGGGCNLSAPVEKDAIVNRFMLQSLASTTTEIAPGYPIEDVPKAYAPIWGSNTPPSGGSKEARRYYYYWRHSNGEETRVEIPVEILRSDPVKAYLTQTGDRTAIVVLKIGEKTESEQVKACRVVRATIDLELSSAVSIEDFSKDEEQFDAIADDWQTDYTRDRFIEPDIASPPTGTMLQWNIDNGQRGNLRIADSQAIALEGDQNAWALGQALKVKVWAISDFPSGTAEEIEGNFAPITEESVSIVAASAVLAAGD